MGKFRNVDNDVVVTVDDSKDDRFSNGGWEPVSDSGAASSKKTATRKASSSKSEK